MRLFAMAVGEELGLGRAEIQRGLAECQPAENAAAILGSQRRARAG